MPESSEELSSLLDTALGMGEHAVERLISMQIKERHTVVVLNIILRLMKTGRNGKAREALEQLIESLEVRHG
jgi:hypothetical protein